MARQATGRPNGRPMKAAYVPARSTGGSLSSRTAAALAAFTEAQAAHVRALVEDADSRMVSIAGIAAGLGFTNPGTEGAMRVRLQAHELLARLTGDLQLAPPPISARVNISGGEAPRVVFLRADDPTGLPEQAGELQADVDSSD